MNKFILRWMKLVFPLWRVEFTGLVIVILGIVLVLAISVLTTRPIAFDTIDVSWPNCHNLGSSVYSSAIVGVSGGLDFRNNPCLGNELRLANSYSLYVNTGNPGFPRIKYLGSQPLTCPKRNNSLDCYSFNYGYQAASYAFRQADLADAHSSFWWLDVETDNSWTNSLMANRADLLGMIYFLKSSLFLVPRLGIYTTTDQWPAIVGNWRINLPLWLGTGANNALEAATDCSRPEVTGEAIVLTQYTLKQLDYNFNCHGWSSGPYF